MEPVVRISPASAWRTLNVSQLWHFRDVLVAMAKRDIKLRYRQTILGVIWVVLQPMLGAGVFTFVFGMIAGMKSGPVPYFVFSYAGLLAWNAFSSTLVRSSGALLQNSGLVSKVYFPRLLLPISTIASTVLDFAVAFAVLLVMLVVYKIPITISVLALPFWLGLAMLLSLGCGMLCGALAVQYRDVNYILPVAMQMWLYASPVAYASTAVPEKFQAIYLLNPLASILDGFRQCLYGQEPAAPWGIWYALVASIGMFVIGTVYFARVEGRFADVI